MPDQEEFIYNPDDWRETDITVRKGTNRALSVGDVGLSQQAVMLPVPTDPRYHESFIAYVVNQARARRASFPDIPW